MQSLKIKLLGAALLLTVYSPARAEDPPQATLQQRWMETYRSIAESIAMQRGGTILELHADPLLVYTNPVRANDQHGVIYLWTQQGRPAVFGSIWSSINRNDPSMRVVSHEWHSLVETPDIRAVRDGQVLWPCDEPGIEWQTLSGSPAVAATPAARLVQMRGLMRRLSATIDTEGESDLRLMSQPLYRYPESAEGVIDGALFVFAMATDPEVVVLIEANEDQSPPQWRIAFARFAARPLEVNDGNQVIWSCGDARPPQRAGKYYLIWRADEMPSEP